MAGAGATPAAVGAVRENFNELVIREPLLTFMASAAGPVARKAVSVAEMAAASCVELSNVVEWGEPFQFTTSPGTKFVPFTVRVSGEVLHDGVAAIEVVDAESDVIVGAATVNVRAGVEVPPPGDGFTTVTETLPVPRAAICAAVMVALSCVELR